MRELFERLVVVDADGEPTRRRASREELDASAEVVDRWAAARLLTLDVHPQTRAPTVEVAHEALVREWPRLRQWIEDDRSELIVLGRLRESAATWADLDREPSALLRGTALEAALDVAGSVVPALAPLEAEFLEASRAARDAEQAEQSELIRRQARTNRRLRLQLGGIAVALVVALVGGLIAIDQTPAGGPRTAHRGGPRAGCRRRRQHPRRPRAQHPAGPGRRGRDPAVRRAGAARGAGGPAPRGGLGPHPALVPRGWRHHGLERGRQALRHRGPRGDRHRRHPRRGDGRTVQKFRGDKIDLNDVVFSPDSRRVVTASDEGAIRVWDIATGRKLGDLTVTVRGRGLGPVRQPRRPPRGGVLARAGKVRVFPATGGEPWVFRAELPGDTAFSPDGRRLAVTSASWRACTSSTSPPTARCSTSGRGRRHRDVAWSPDGRWIAVTGGPDGAPCTTHAPVACGS